MQSLSMNTFNIGIFQRYLICNPLPKTTEEIEKVTEMMHQSMVVREDEFIEKLHQVIGFATGEDCK